MLFVVEGGHTEPKLIRKLAKVYGLSPDREIYPYGTNVHAMLNEIEYEFPDLSDVDLLQFLRRREGNNGSRRAMIEGRFTDVVLIFDYERQDSSFDQNRLKRLLEVFNDSTDMGKLYINYPMVESYKDVLMPCDDLFLGRTIACNKCTHYKRIVSDRSKLRNLIQENGERDAFSWIIEMNVIKVLHLLNSDTNLMSFSEACRKVSEGGRDIKLLQLQNHYAESDQKIYVCCTCLFFLCENWPSKIEPSVSIPVHTPWPSQSFR